jgi:integrase
MPNHKKQPLAYIDYKPAKLCKPQSGNWCVRFQYKIPGTDKFKYFRRRVKPLKNINEREKLGKQITNAINTQLSSGWSPFKGNTSGYFISDLLEAFKEHTEKNYKKGNFRFDTKRSYLSGINKFQNFLRSKGLDKLTTEHFDKSIIMKYIDYMEFELKNSGKTVNNNVTFLKIVSNYLVDYGYIEYNPVHRIKKKRETKKKRQVIPEPYLNRIFSHLKNTNENFYVICLLCYFCFLRRTELTKLKVNCIDINNRLLYVPTDVSKNRKDDYVTIPEVFVNKLKKHISNAKPTDYLFNYEDFETGTKNATAKQITYNWIKLKIELGLPNEYDFYSLKDTGITKLLEAGIPIIKVRDQARHHDIKITEKYTPRRTTADDTIRNIYNKMQF